MHDQVGLEKDKIIFSAITCHIWFDTTHRTATFIHLGRQHKFGGFYVGYWCSVEYKQAE